MPPSRRLGRLLLSLAFGAACSTHIAAAQPGSSVSAVAQLGATASRAIGPGDRVLLRVWHEPTWSDSLLVGPDGDLVLPRIGRYHAAGVDPVALRDTIQRRLAVYLRDPSVDVVVLRRVAVLGAVRKPDVYYVDAVSTLRDVLARAGGLSDDADPNRIEIVRGGRGTPLGAWKDIGESVIPVQSGDEVQVGKRSWLARNAVATVSSAAVAVSVLLTALKR